MVQWLHGGWKPQSEPIPPDAEGQPNIDGSAGAIDEDRYWLPTLEGAWGYAGEKRELGAGHPRHNARAWG